MAAFLDERYNDLTEAAIGFAPVIGDVLETLNASGNCLLARMSGSGATGLGLYGDGGAARGVPQERRMETAMEYAQRALDMAPRAVRNNKQVIYRGAYMDPIQGDVFGNALEQNLRGMQDSIEGPSAFSEKRRPNFTDS